MGAAEPRGVGRLVNAVPLATYRSMTILEKDNTLSADNQNHLLQVLEMEMSRISSLDSTIFTIKGWSVTLASALVGFSLTSTTTGGFILSKGLLGIAIFSTLIFMIIDIHFRKVQLDHVATVKCIRKLLIESKESNIWQELWGEIEKKNNNCKSVRSPRDCFFTVLPYSIIVILPLHFCN